MDWAMFFPRFLGGGIRRQPGVQTANPLVTFRGERKNVSEETAMQISAVWAAVELKARVLASLDLLFYDVQGPGMRSRNEDLQLARLFNDKPNRYQTRVEFFETLGLNLYLTGNAYCKIERVGGQIVSLMPIMSSQVEVELQPDGTVLYTYTNGQDVAVYAASSIWHVKLFGNGIVGMSPLRYAANSIGMSISGEEWASNILANGGKPTGVLTIDNVLSDEQRDRVRKSFKELREGPRDALMVLEAGMKYQQVSLSPQDVELLAARRFQIEDIARFFGVPSVLINDTSGSTVWGSGIEQIVTGWYKIGFRPELERIETSIRSNLLSKRERDTIAVEFDFEELLRTDFKARVEAGSRAVASGLMTHNEWREREWLPPKPGADNLTVQVNMTPLDQLARVNGGENGT